MNLDCETPELAVQSLAAILQIERAQLKTRICSINRNDFQTNTCTTTDRRLPMLNAVAGREVLDSATGKTCWFHATRTNNLSSFRKGIMPLPTNVDRIWDMLHMLVTDCTTPGGWDEFRRETVARNYGHAEMVIEAWMSDEGPYAFLFSESALNPNVVGNHDFFSTSELIDWIAVYFERRFRVSLRDRHHAATRPAFIKFWTPGIKATHLGAAVDYLVHRHLGWSLSCVDPCFSAEGEQIEPEQVIKAVPVLERIRRFQKHPIYSLSPMTAHVPLLGSSGTVAIHEKQKL